MVTQPACARRFGIAPFLAVVLAIATLGVFASAAAAQEPMIDFRIFKIDCPEDPGQFPEGIAPEGCTPVEGVDFTIEVEGVAEPLTCTTNADGRCLVQVESEANVTVTEDTSTGTEGYAPLENPIETQAISEFAGAVFVNVPEDTTGLPDTGAGSSRAAVDPGTAGILLVVATLLGLAGSLYQRTSPR